MTEERGIDFATTESQLCTAEFLDCRALWYSSNYVYLAHMRTLGGAEITSIYKPLSGEAPLWDFPDGLYRREAAAYQLSQLLGWPFIPPTIVRDGPEGVGSVQLFIEHDPQSHFFTQREDPQLTPQLQRIAVFDVVANNADRKGGHCLLDDANQVWGIDHGLCFHRQYKLRSVIWDWVGDPIAEPLLDALKTAHQALTDGTPETLPLVELIDASEVGALRRRIEQLVAAGTYPRPGTERHYPWPLI